MRKLSLASSCFVWYVGTIEISVLTAVFGCGCAEGCINCEYISGSSEVPGDTRYKCILSTNLATYFATNDVFYLKAIY